MPIDCRFLRLCFLLGWLALGIEPAMALEFFNGETALQVEVYNERRQPLLTTALTCSFRTTFARVKAAATGYQQATVDVPLPPGESHSRVEVVLKDLDRLIEIKDVQLHDIASAYIDRSQFNVHSDDYAIDLFLPPELLASPSKEQFVITDSLWWAYPLKNFEVKVIEGFHHIRLTIDRADYQNIQTVLWVVVAIGGDRITADQVQIWREMLDRHRQEQPQLCDTLWQFLGQGFPLEILRELCDDNPAALERQRSARHLRETFEQVHSVKNFR